MNYDFNKAIGWKDVNSYKGKPIMVKSSRDVFAYILTLEGYDRQVRGKYLVETIRCGQHRTKENLEIHKTSANVHMIYTIYVTEKYDEARTLTMEEYKTYKEILTKKITYDNWI